MPPTNDISINILFIFSFTFTFVSCTQSYIKVQNIAAKTIIKERERDRERELSYLCMKMCIGELITSLKIN